MYQVLVQCEANRMRVRGPDDLSGMWTAYSSLLCFRVLLASILYSEYYSRTSTSTTTVSHFSRPMSQGSPIHVHELGEPWLMTGGVPEPDGGELGV